MEPAIAFSNNNLTLLINNIQKTQLSLIDWQTEKLNFIPLRGSWFANSEADFDLEEGINKFLLPQNNKKVMLLIGDSGAGKSLYTQGLINKLWQNFSAQSPIPIWISLPSIKHPTKKLIQKALKKYGFDSRQIKELRKTRSFVFILDAYDEIRCEKNLYQTNHLDRWNAKIIITCRREYLYYKDNYKLFFAPFIGDKIQYTQYEEIYIRPFNANQIQNYVQQYIKTQKPNWSNPERYLKAIGEITGLNELIKTPFMLKLAMEELPQIIEKYVITDVMQSKKVTQAALYDVFIEQWFSRQEQKLKEAKLIKQDENIKAEFWEYAKALATEMHKANLTLINYSSNEESDLFSTEVKEYTWAKFFTPKNPRIELLRTACLVREANQHHYAFIHSSLIEYFLTRKLFEDLLENKVTQVNNNDTHELKPHSLTVQVKTGQGLDTTSNKMLQQDYFNQRLITKEANTLQFLADRVSEEEMFKESLFNRVYSSKNTLQNKISAANAITILNKAKVAFSGMDLSHIHISDADLSEAIMHHTDVSNSDLQRVNLQDAYLCDANFSGCQMAEIQLGQLPMLKHHGLVKSICYSKDSCYLAVASGEQIIVWDMKSMKVHGLLDGHLSLIMCLTFSLDGKLLASGGQYKNELLMWDMTSKQLLGRLQPGHTHTVTSVAFSPDRKILASGSEDKTIRLWDVGTLQPLGKTIQMQEQLYTNYVLCIAFSPDGKLLASGSKDNILRLWDVATQQPLGKPMMGHANKRSNIEFRPDGETLASGDSNGKIPLPNALIQQLMTMPVQISVTSLAFSPDGKLLASGGSDGKLHLWEVATQQLQGTPLEGHHGIASIAFSPDGKLLASGNSDRTVRLWDVATWQSLGKPLQGHSLTVNSVTFSPDGRLLSSGSDDKTVRLWEVSIILNSLAKSMQGHTNIVESISLSPDGKLLASGGWDRTLRLWDVATRQSLSKSLLGHTNILKSVAFSPDGKLLATGSADKTLRLWEVTTMQPYGKVMRVKGHLFDDNQVNSIAFSPDSKLLVSGDRSGEMRLWEVATQEPLSNPLQVIYNIWIENVAFSPDGKLLVCGCSDNKLRLYEIVSQQLFGKLLQGHASSVRSVVFSPDGKLLASGSNDKTVRLWEVANQQPLGKPLEVHTDSVASVSFSPDGNLLASGSSDKTVAVWSVGSQHCLYRISALKEVNSVCFSFIGHYLAFASGNHVGLFHYQSFEREPFKLNLIWYSGQIFLMADGLCLNDTTGLSSYNLKIFNQNCIIQNDNKRYQSAGSKNLQPNDSLDYVPRPSSRFYFNKQPNPNNFFQPLPTVAQSQSEVPLDSLKSNPHKLF